MNEVRHRALMSIYDKYGELTPRLVVTEARHPEHVLHVDLEWDDSVGGERYREMQAAALIRSVRVTWASQDQEPVRAFHSITRADGCSYEPIEVILADDVKTQLLLRTAEREWRTMFRRYKHLDEFIVAVRRDVA